MPRDIKPEHRQRINDHLAEYGIIAFPEINEFAGKLSLQTVTQLRDQTLTGKYVKSLIDRGTHVIIPLPKGKSQGRTGRSASERGVGYVYHVVEADLEPFVKEARLGHIMGRSELPSVITALLKIKKQGAGGRRHVFLDFSSKGTRQLIRAGLLKHVRFKPGEKPESLKRDTHKYRITDPALMKRITTAVARAIWLQEKRYR